MAAGDAISGGFAFFLDLGKSHERICGALFFVRDGGGTLLLLLIVAGRIALLHVAGGSLSSDVWVWPARPVDRRKRSAECMKAGWILYAAPLFRRQGSLEEGKSTSLLEDEKALRPPS